MTLVRHGATLWNATGRFQGHSDVALSELGRAQAGAVARHLSRQRFDRIYSSDLSRALETANIIAAEHNVAVTQDRRLREFYFGAWEGLTWDEIVASYPSLANGQATEAIAYAPEGGERFDDVVVRTADFLHELGELDVSDVAIVTHAGVLHAAMAALRLEPDAGAAVLRFAPAGITAVTMEDATARLMTLNDVRHLDPAG